MSSSIEYQESENKTYEVRMVIKEAPGYIKRTVLYRFWEVGDGDWKIIMIDSDDDASRTNPAILLPKKVIDKIIKTTVKGELRK